MNTDNPPDPTGKDDLSPAQRAMIAQEIVIAANMAGVALTFAGLPGTGPVLAGLGGLLFQTFAPGKSPEAEYYQALSEQIQEMEQAVLSDLTTISQQISDLQVDLEQIAHQLSLQINLQTFNECRSVIDQYYADFVSNVNGLSKNPKDQALANQYFQLLQNHADDVAIKMRLLHLTVLDQDDGQLGLISQQAQFMVDATDKWIADTDNYKGGSSTYHYDSFTTYNCRAIVHDAYGASAGHVLGTFVLPLVNTILLLQYRGLTFLTTAWAGSDKTDQIQDHLTNSKQIIGSINRLLQSVSDPKTIDAVIKAAIKTTRFRRTPKLIGNTDSIGNRWMPHDVGVNGWVFWADTYSPFFSPGSQGTAFKAVNVSDDIVFDQNYDSYVLSPTNQYGPFHGFMHAAAQQTYIPSPGSVAPKPLAPGAGVTGAVLTQTLAQAQGPSLLISQVPASSGGTVAGSLEGQPDAAALQVQVFEYLGDKAWKRQASNVAIGGDGGFTATIGGGNAVFWTVLATQPGWTYDGGNTGQDAPIIAPGVVAYITVPPS